MLASCGTRLKYLTLTKKKIAGLTDLNMSRRVAYTSPNRSIAFLALSLLQEGYTVYANADASGFRSQRIADDANGRMCAAGVSVLSGFAVVCGLMRD